MIAKLHLVGVLLSAILAMPAFADLNFTSASQISAMQVRIDGQYDVVCIDGTKELVTSEEISRNNVCPNSKAKVESGIQSMIRNDDGTYAVICKDASRATVTVDQVLNGSACSVSSSPTTLLMNGNYAGEGYCPQRATTTSENGKLTLLRLDFLSPCADNDGVSLECSSNSECDGVHVPTNDKIHITIIDSSHYTWQDSNGGAKVTFAYGSSNARTEF
jgi:hypothetical protein